MSETSQPGRTLRVAIIGSGPAGFYAVEHLFKAALPIEIDMFERLPTPFGLVRGGVAPDHANIKTVSKLFEKLAAHAGYRFFGNVTLGRDVLLAELRRHYDALIYAVGAQSDRHLGIPGEDLPGSHPATEFVGWYNGHPDYRHLEFDLSQTDVAVIGMGNVAMDVARILARTPEELATTDIAAHALEALSHSAVRTITLIGRRGPAQAAFTAPEIRELGEMPGADIVVSPEDLELDLHTRAALALHEDRVQHKNLEILAEHARRTMAGKPRQIVMRFLASPVALHGTARVESMTLAHNQLVPGENGDLKAVPTGIVDTLPAGLVFRSVGYQATPVEGLPFDPRRTVVPNIAGRVVEASGATAVVPGLYVTGWIKRGPTGVIGTNKPDAIETTDRLLEDADAGRLPARAVDDASAILRLLAERRVAVVTWEDWHRIDALERARGAELGRPRVKFSRHDELLAAARRTPA